MSLTVKWDEGVSIEYRDTKLIFDPQSKNQYYSNVFITHAHYDHSKGFSFGEIEKVSTEETAKIVKSYGKEVKRWKPLPIEGKVKINDLEVISHNAGHVLGSALYEIITTEGNIVYTGDLQFKDSFTLKGAEPISCDILIIESTFGSPSFKFQDREKIAQEIIQWAQKTIKSGRVPAFKADSLGNAQEITKAFNIYSKLPVTVHWKIAPINEIYRASGQSLEFLNARSEEATEVISSGDCIFVAPKNVVADNPEFESALVSGWALWARNRENAFALSDHADFNQLMEFVKACKPKVVLTCFGGKFNTIFANQVEKQLRIEARPLDLIPTKFLPDPPNAKVKSCMKEILKTIRMPGFVYSKSWISGEMRALGFLENEINEAMNRLTRRGTLRASKNSLQKR